MKVLLVDDHPLFTDGLRNLLTAHGIEVLGVARNGLEALDKARALRPEVILMDIQMPGMNGLAAVRMIKKELADIRVVILTMSADDDDLFEAIRNGACGYLLKTQDTEEFFSLLKDVTRGEVALAPGLASRILQEFKRQASIVEAIGQTPQPSLSERELQVLTLVAQRLTYKEVGAKLFLSERTIKYHMSEIIERLHLHSRTELIDYAKRAGLG
jgi:two-component system NarL family response regulator